MKHKANLAALEDLFNTVLKSGLLAELEVKKDEPKAKVELPELAEQDDDGPALVEEVKKPKAVSLSITRLGALENLRDKKKVESKEESKKKHKKG